MTTTDTAEWDDGTLALLRDGDGAEEGPATVSELVLVPGYSQSEWDRRQVRMLTLAHDAELYLWNNLHKSDEVLVRDLLLGLGRDRAAAAFMNPDGRMVWDEDAGHDVVFTVSDPGSEELVYREVAGVFRWEAPVRSFTPARKTRPSQRRKANLNGKPS